MNGRCCVLTWRPAGSSGKRRFIAARRQTPIHLKSSYGAETPVTDGERVYAMFGDVGLFAFTLDGKDVWSHRLEPRKMRYGWGTAASPVLRGGRLFIVNDNEERAELFALDAKTGQELWRVDRDEKSNWATPFIWDNGQRTELITPGSRAVRGYDLEGRLLWSLTGMSSIAIPTPVAGDGLLFVSSGYVGDKLRPLYAIRPGAQGDITLKAGETNNAFIAWSNPVGGPYNPSPLFYEGRVYVLYDRGLVSCYDGQDRQAALRPRAPAQGFRLHRLTVGGERPGVLPERRRRRLRAARGRHVRVAPHQQAGGRRHVHGHAGVGGRPPAHPHRRAALLLPVRYTGHRQPRSRMSTPRHSRSGRRKPPRRSDRLTLRDGAVLRTCRVARGRAGSRGSDRPGRGFPSMCDDGRPLSGKSLSGSEHRHCHRRFDKKATFGPHWAHERNCQKPD